MISLSTSQIQIPSKVSLEPFQSRIVQELIDKITLDPYNAILLRGGTGVGKTFINGAIIKWQLENDLRFSNYSKGFPIIYLTKASVVQQTREVLFQEFRIPPDKLWVCNYDQLRSQLGGLWITWEKIKNPRWLITPNSEEYIEIPIWIKDRMPLEIFCDECHALKNVGTLQTEIMRSYVIQSGLVIASGATPFTRLFEAEFLVLSIRPKVLGWGIINEKTWPAWSRELAGSHSSPTEYNWEAVKRLMRHIEHRIVQVKGVKFPVKSHNHCRLVVFESRADRIQYTEAYDKYIEELERIDRYAPEGPIAILVATNKFREASEFIRAPYQARVGVEIATKHNKQVIIGFNFLKSLKRCHQTLLDLGIPSNQISLIVGGQTSKIRELNKSRFQNGETTYLLMTIKSGGVGLSLDHNQKNRLIAKPRHVIAPIPWSAVELVQFIGRTLRLKTVSDVHQDVIGFQDTVEVEVIEKLEQKFRCLKEVVGKQESWVGLFTKKHELDSIHEITQLVNNEVQETDEFGGTEEFAEELVDNMN